MMQPYPFFGFPRYRRGYPYYLPYYSSHNSNVNSIKNEQKPCSPNVKSKKEQGNFSCSSNFSKNSNFSNIGFSNEKNSSYVNNGFNNKKPSTYINNDFHCKKATTNNNNNNNVDCNCINDTDICNDCNDFNDYDEEQCFEIFGLQLHFDDLLIIALLFFLYQEEVKDTYLYISLILLLLS